MDDTRRHAMTSAKWLRIAALAALFAFAFHGAAALEHQHDAGGERDCALCHVGHVHALAPEPPDRLAVLPAAGSLAAVPAIAAVETSRALPPSRGPPAA